MTPAKKLRVLMCSEASFLSSGFGIYAKEILSRLYNTNKYEIAEFASYGYVNDARDTSIRWRYYANAVKSDDPRYNEYMSRGDNQFGRWRFEKVLLDFKPDIVIDVRDYWMSAYQSLSPLRKFFHWALMPTVDSEPQQEEWISTFLSADAIFTYSDWGAEVLKKQSNNKINYIDTTSPGVNLSVFKPQISAQKQLIRESIGIPKDAFVIGSVMRNQKRKLIPELMNVLSLLLNSHESCDSLKDNAYLYLHTSYPDAGWDIPQILKEYNVINRVLFSYTCKKCSFLKAQFFVGPVATCPKCLEKSMTLSSVTNGVSEENLAKIYNTFDLYVQYSICEGFGMPQIEAGSCGVPIATVNYSAMCDVVNKLKAYPIKISSYFKELETQAIRTYPDNLDLMKYIIQFYNYSDKEKLELSKQTRQLTEKHYDWDHIAKKWESYLDNLSQHYTSKWNKEPTLMRKIDKNDIPNNLSAVDTIKYIVDNHMNASYDMSNRVCLEMLKQADYHFVLNGMTITEYNIADIVNYFNIFIDNNNQAEYARLGNLKFNDDFIEYANIKDHKK